MVQRSFFAFDNEALIVDDSSPVGDPGDPVVDNFNTPDGTILVFSDSAEGEQVTIDDTGGSPDVFEDGIPDGHIVIEGGSLISAGSTVEAESILILQQIDEAGDPVGPEISINVFSAGGITRNAWGFSGNVLLTPGARYVKVDGASNGGAAYGEFAPCFVAGTRIMTPGGEQRVEEITVGAQVWTRGNPAAVVTWAGRARVSGQGAMAPVVIAAGALGNSEEIAVSPQHRILVQGYHAHLLFAEPEVLVPAIGLLALPGVERRPQPWVAYHHLMFHRHEIVGTSGMLSESFYPGAQAVSALDRAARGELLSLFPELAREVASFGPPAAPVLTRAEGRALSVMMERA